ncbi:hypothetical protein [Leadbettera azotonutricia]|uniref:hypothetical protein n=1 Tax=Leadbettera azotonutricia TaxID=150829 RepID=UPI0011D1E46B|nr:hypothetical protein [Leadbettera azotonutricia]
MASCANGTNPDAGLGDDDSVPLLNASIAAVPYAENGPDLGQLQGWQWAKEGTDFKWIFKNDGTIWVIHCCGELYKNQFSYLISGNVLITYGTETEKADELIVSTFTMASDSTSFTRTDGLGFVRGNAETADTGNFPSLVLKNDFIGKWLMNDGSIYLFSNAGELTITSPSGTEESCAYFIRDNQLLTLGPLSDGTKVPLRQYRFQRGSGKITLRNAADSGKFILTPFVE